MGTESDYSYDVVTGVSAGAINAAALALWPPGTERNATEYISEVWNNITNDDFYESSATSWLSAPFHKSVYGTEPAKKLIRGVLDTYGGFERKISVSAVDVESGEIFTATEGTVDFDQFHLAVLASASVPGLFPPVRVDGRLLMDGGTTYNTNVE